MEWSKNLNSFSVYSGDTPKYTMFAHKHPSHSQWELRHCTLCILKMMNPNELNTTRGEGGRGGERHNDPMTNCNRSMQQMEIFILKRKIPLFIPHKLNDS